MHKSLNLSKQLINFIRKFEIKQSYSEKKETSSKSVKTINPRNSEKKTVYKKNEPKLAFKKPLLKHSGFYPELKEYAFYNIDSPTFPF